MIEFLFRYVTKTKLKILSRGRGPNYGWVSFMRRTQFSQNALRIENYQPCSLSPIY